MIERAKALESTLPWPTLSAAIIGGFGLYGIYHHFARLKQIAENENMKDLELRNIALQMVSQAAKLIDHLASSETALRERIKADQEALAKERDNYIKQIEDQTKQIATLEKTRTSLKEENAGLTKRVGELQAQLVGVNVPSPISISTPTSQRRKRRARG